MFGLEGIVNTLEDYYQSNQSWSGVEQVLIAPGQGQGNRRGNQGFASGIGSMMGQGLKLADAKGNLLLDTGNPNAQGELDQSTLQGAIPLQFNDQVVGYLVHGGGTVFTSGDESELLGRLTEAAYIAAGVAIAFALLLSLLLSSRLLKPVQTLTRAAEDLTDGDLSKRVKIDGNDELAVLGRTFNEMANSLENAEKSRRAMTADIAHELRTPLAVQRAQLEALQDGIYEATDENFAVLLEQNILLSRLVADLSTLALADSGQLQLDRTPTDLVKLTGRVADQFRPRAAEIGVEIDFTQQGSCREINLDPGRVEQIIGNIISNALRYSPENSQLKINLVCSSDSAVISIRDQGPGIPEEAQEQIFERFYRADHSRSRADGGTGLGLAIARQLAEAQGGQLIASNHPDGGAEFCLTFYFHRPNA
jgi:signal transduction histidine kinase